MPLKQWKTAFQVGENIEYSNLKQFWVFLDSNHPCLYGLLENKEYHCPNCGKLSSIPNYYLKLTNKVK